MYFYSVRTFCTLRIIGYRIELHRDNMHMFMLKQNQIRFSSTYILATVNLKWPEENKIQTI
jgi:hypothetical protein